METLVKPEVGMGATRCSYTDRYPYTIARVVSERCLEVVADIATRTDDNGMSESQSYAYKPSSMPPIRIRLGKTGWASSSGDRFVIGSRRRYHDYSF